MSVLIKGMDAPRDCYECEFAYTLDGCCHCSLLHDGIVETHMDRRAEDCPMVEIPPGHGDLVDRGMQDDVIMSLNENDWQITRGEYKRFDRILFEFPVIVPREG